MKKDFLRKIFGLLSGFVLIFAMSNAVSAQGKSGNKANKSNKGSVNTGNRGNSNTRGNSDSRDRSDRNDDRNDDSSRRDNDRRQNENRNRRNDDRDDDLNNDRGGSNRFRGVAKKIGMSPEEARDFYEREKDRNPDLTYGQFVAANMIARKHGSQNPRLTTEAIFDRLSNGENLGQAVKNLGLKDKDYKEMQKRMKRDSKNDRDDDDDDDDYR